MVLALLHSGPKRNASFFAGIRQQPGAKTVGQEAIRRALVNEELGKAQTVLDQGDRIPRPP